MMMMMMRVPLLLLVIVLYKPHYADAEATEVDFPCPDVAMSLNRFAQYTCSVSDGSGFLRWRIVGFGSTETSILFSSNDDSVGQNEIDDGFSATLISETNGLASVLSFEVTLNHGSATIICEDPADGNMSQCNVIVPGLPIQVSGTSVNYTNFTSVIINWIGLPDPFIIAKYEVQLLSSSSNMTSMYYTTDESIKINGLERGVEYTVVIFAIDNADRRGEASDSFLFTPDSPANVSGLKASAIYNGSDYTIILSWIQNESSRPDVLQYCITYTLEGITTSDTTSDTRYTIPKAVESLKPFNFTLVAANVLGETVLHDGTITSLNFTTSLTVENISINEFEDEFIGVLIAFCVTFSLLIIGIPLFLCLVFKYCKVVNQKVHDNTDPEANPENIPLDTLDEKPEKQ